MKKFREKRSCASVVHKSGFGVTRWFALFVVVAALILTSSLARAQQAGANTAPSGNAQNGKKNFASDGCYECHGFQGQGATQTGAKVQKAWLDLEVVQCGYCQSGQIMSATALLAATPHPDDSDIDAAMAGNICRCGTYVRIREAIKRAAGERQS